MKNFLLLFPAFAALILTAAPAKIITAVEPAGMSVKFSGKISSGDDVPAGTKVLYEEFVNGIRKRHGFIKFDEEITLTYKMAAPGWYMAKVSMVDNGGRPVVIPGRESGESRGVLIAPEKIPSSLEKPADFDEFWDSRRKLLDKVPVKEWTRREIKERSNDNYAVYEVKVACAGSMPMTGILTIPRNAKERSLPAFVFFQGAGVATAVPFGGLGKDAITLMVNAHGIDNLREKSYYSDLQKGKLSGYPHFNKDDREKIYFHDMFLRVMRALDYVKTLPEWNGKVLVVRGGSQGGAQAIVAAAMDKQVTMLIAEVPAMCDHNGFFAKPARRCGWPVFYGFDRKMPQVMQTVSYYDMVNFASRVHCETFITAGLTDMISVPVGVVCAYNAIPAGKKSLLIHPTGGHVSTQRDREFLRKMLDRLTEHLLKQ